jgi:hypothetical protein
MTDANYTHISFLLDRSGSMASIRDDAIGGFNGLVEDQRKVPGRCTLTLTQFDNQDSQEVVFDTVPLAQLPDLTRDIFVPRGATPLLDAMGLSIEQTGQKLAALPEHDRPSRVIFVIYTDGLENASCQYTRERVFEMIRHQREGYRWQFLFLGADQDAIAVARGFGIDAGSAMTTDKSGRGVRMALASSSRLMSKMRSAPDAAAASFTESDRAEQDELIGSPKGG